MKVRVGIVGGTGYAGGELMRIISQHPHAQVVYAASRTQAGQPVATSHPGLNGLTDLAYETIDTDAIASRCDVVFLAVPHGASMALAAELVPRGVKVIDIGTDFRFRDPAEYKQWYGIEHEQVDLLAEAVYGLPEL
ncbi:MAG: Gfo/Idh/MocA family oxidoreductase, partial [Bacillota bacterium]